LSDAAKVHPLVVVGAGAAGLWAAARAAEAGQRTLLLEKTPRTGTKVLASGGTRCNLTTTLSSEQALPLFGRPGARFLRPAFRALSPADVRQRFHELGVPTVEAALEKVFPASQRARDVRDALEGWARAAGVQIRLNAGLRALAPRGDGWALVLESGAELLAERVILACGGKSYARTGTTGDGYAWLAELGLRLVSPVPALVPLSSPATWVSDLAGIALQDTEVRIARNGKTLALRARPVLFTHRGLSGPGAMDLSETFARAQEQGESLPELRLDLMPGWDRAGLREALRKLETRGGAPPLLRRALADRLPEPLPRRLIRAVTDQADCPRDLRANELGKAQRHALIESLKGLLVPVDGTLGFDQAEVTAGGLALSELDPGSMRVRKHAGLFVCGELLDLAGPIGGLNFQSAFSTAEVAARAVAAG
jgi:predicted Rossmann fold flavoprotein